MTGIVAAEIAKRRVALAAALRVAALLLETNGPDHDANAVVIELLTLCRRSIELPPRPGRPPKLRRNVRIARVARVARRMLDDGEIDRGGYDQVIEWLALIEGAITVESVKNLASKHKNAVDAMPLAVRDTVRLLILRIVDRSHL